MKFLPVAVAAALFLPRSAGFAPPMSRAEGLLAGTVAAAQTRCRPGAVCASAILARHDCYFVNVATARAGGSPLAIDSTQTGPASPTTVYWVNDTDHNVAIQGTGDAYYSCAK